MGNRGFNAGGFAYMPRVRCRHCGRKFVIGQTNLRRSCTQCWSAGKPTIHVSEEEARAERDAYFRERRQKRAKK